MTSASNPYDLERFVQAQSDVFEQVRAELQDGEKQTHWMWFIFPQIQGLGGGPMARKFALSGLDEASAYLRHPLLGTRLRECTELVCRIRGRSIEQILHHPDNLKFRSSMTLFAHATADNRLFVDAIGRYCNGEFDHRTLQQLGIAGA